MVIENFRQHNNIDIEGIRNKIMNKQLKIK